MAVLSSKQPTAPAKRGWLKRNLVPTLSGVALTLLILGVLNGEWLIAQLRYRFGQHATVTSTIAPPTDTPLQPDPSAPAELTIPSISVKAPIIFDEPDVVEWKVQLALRRGVVHYGQTATPGQKGNVVIIGHSSGRAWAPGDYKWVFTLLDKLEAGDQIQVSYQGIPYIYEVTGKTVVSPERVEVLVQTEEPTLSLITCTPVGTDKNRLIVTAKLVSPQLIASKQ